MDGDRFANTRQPDWDWWARLWPAPGETLRALGVAPGRSVAEVCSGNGYFALPAARIAAPAPVYAVEIDESLLAELRELAALHEIENIETIHGDARALSTLLPAPVDVCLLLNTFHGIDDPAAVAREAAGVLADDGAFVVANWHARPREETTIAGEPRGPPTDLRLTPEETAALVTDATDLRVARRLELPPYHYAVVFEPDR